MGEETNIAPPGGQSEADGFISRNRGGLIGALIAGIIGLLVGGPLGMLAGPLLAIAGGLMGSAVFDREGGMVTQAAKAFSPSAQRAEGDPATRTAGQSAESALAPEAAAAGDSLNVGEIAANVGMWIAAEKAIKHGGVPAARWAATTAAPAVGAWVTGTALPAMGGAAVATGETLAASAAATTAAGLATAAGAGIVIGTGAAYAIDRWVLNGGEGIETIYNDVDKAFHADSRNLNINGAQAQMNRHMERFGGVRDPNGNFSLLIPENRSALNAAIEERKAELTSQMEENAPPAWTRYLQFTQGQADRRIAYENMRLELRSLNSAQEEMPGFIARQEERALALLREREAQRQADNAITVTPGMSPAHIATTVSAPQTPTVSGNKNSKPAALGADGLPVPSSNITVTLG